MIYLDELTEIETFTEEEIFKYFRWKQGLDPHSIPSIKPIIISKKREESIAKECIKVIEWSKKELTEEELQNYICEKIKKEHLKYTTLIFNISLKRKTIDYYDNDIDPILHPNQIYVRTAVKVRVYGTQYYGKWVSDTHTKKELKQIKEDMQMELINHLRDHIHLADQYIMD